jgi:hypothetical protein
MKKLFSVLAMAMLVLSVLPVVLGNDVGVGIGVSIGTEDYAPNIWMCDSRVVLDDNTEPGRVTTQGICTDPAFNNDEAGCVGAGETFTEVLVERESNYAFEGEQISYKVLVKDKNGIQKISDVFGTLGSVQGAGNQIEVNCVEDLDTDTVLPSCNARILEEKLESTDFEASTMRYYDCTLTVETAASHAGEHWFTVEAMDLDGLSDTVDENEYWFFNPVIGLDVTGDLTFSNVRPGTQSYSDTLLVENAAEDRSGVRMDMFVSGTDFYDSASSGAACPTTNQLSLGQFAYFATSGAYSSEDDVRAGADPEGENYVPIGYATGFNNPTPFYGAFEIIQTSADPAVYSNGNVLTPGAEIAMTFRLDLPEPCNGDFDTGSINFWGEAI